MREDSADERATGIRQAVRFARIVKHVVPVGAQPAEPRRLGRLPPCRAGSCSRAKGYAADQ